MIMVIGMLGLVTFPLKIIMQFVKPGSEKSTAFAVIFSACVFGMMLLASRLTNHSKVNYSFKNFLLAGLRGICGLACAWNGIVHFNGPAPSDSKFKFLFFSVFSLLAALFFAFVSYSHLSGKNAFKTVQILVFAPVIMYIMSLTLFLSFELGEPSAYNVLAQCLSLLFFVYYSHFYVKCSNKNFKKRCLAFGIPAVTVNLCHFIPTAVSSSLGSPTSTFSFLSVSISAYILLFLINDVKLSDDNLENKRVAA